MRKMHLTGCLFHNHKRGHKLNDAGLRRRGRRFDNQRQCNLATFGHQDIVGAACRLIIHAFDADTPGGKRGYQLGMNKTLSCSSTENDDIRHGGIDLVDMRHCKCIERLDRPINRRNFRQHDQALRKVPGIDIDAGIVVTSDCLILLSGCGV